MVDGEVEVVGQRDHLGQQDLVGEAEHLLPFLRRAALQVRVIGLGALGERQVLDGQRLRGVTLGRERLDLREERRRARVELGDALLRPRPSRRGRVVGVVGMARLVGMGGLSGLVRHAVSLVRQA